MCAFLAICDSLNYINNIIPRFINIYKQLAVILSGHWFLPSRLAKWNAPTAIKGAILQDNRDIDLDSAHFFKNLSE
jgi:hypothetical protein